MNKIIYLLTFICFASLWTSCSDDEPGKNSIFDTDPPARNEFDLWLLENFTYPYNINFKYRMEHIESSQTHTLVPAEYNKSIALAKLVKYLWLEVYDEAAGVHFTRSYIPRIIHLIGSAAYNSNKTMVLGTAEGGLKVTLYMVNDLDVDNVSIDFLNTYYFKTMHHEFNHILTQKKKYDPDFQRISEADYISSNWYQETNETAHELGFVSNYAMKEYNEDFAEIFAVYLTSTQAEWDAILDTAGETGAPIILKKFNIVKKYLADSWDIDFDELRNIVQRRSGEIYELDLKNL
ncbi:putative zinc-binding metallopeptidase [Bacteroides sp. 224]|uniref:zinc-binding metallopeptidase n=1 Tax=Bacteroides sp. 224 TaxID=2302936 RepID=UPI0013D78FE4|nr:putative zinc-binding metallopeptidase [Bacteroides sp. 224]NDV65743.1 hypothetical protein [Bacteroides sp. 224]